MSARNWGLLLFLSLLWGSSFFFYKLLGAVLPPVTVVFGRLGIAAVAMNLWLLTRGQRLPRSPRLWARFTLLGLLNTAIPFVLVAWGETRITSGLASILNATMPIFTVVVAHFGTHDDKMSPGKIAGIALGIVGVCVLVGRDALAGNGEVLGELAMVTASCTYAFAVVYSRRFRALPPLLVATGQVTAAALVLLPLSLLLDRPWTLPFPGWNVWAPLLAIALVNTALAYVLYFRMLATVGATYMSLVTFLNPVIALLLGTAVLGERITPQALAGMAIIALGLAAINGRRLNRRLSRRPSPID